MDTMRLTEQQTAGIAELPPHDRVVGVDGGGPLVRKPGGELMRIQRNGRIARATAASERRLAERHENAPTAHGVKAATPYTSVMD